MGNAGGERVETVRAVHDGWAQGDFRVAQELFGAGILLGPARRGGRVRLRPGPEVRDALRNLFFDVYDDYRVEPRDFIDGGDEVVVVARSKGTARRAVVELDQSGHVVWTEGSSPGRGLR